MKHLYFPTLSLLLSVMLIGCGSGSTIVDYGSPTGIVNTKMVALAYNDLGMHCMNQDFSEMAILPPFNNLYAQVILRGDLPEIIESGVMVNYSIPGNTHSASKTNFWTYLRKLNIPLPNNLGLTGHKLSGTMKPAAGRNDWVADGIPLTPVADNGKLNSYQVASVKVIQSGAQVALTNTVVPVSWEMSCNLCHKTAGISTAKDILRKHDKLHGTHFDNQQHKPIVCGACHTQAPLVPLGLAGNPDLPSLSRAMHSAHANRMNPVQSATGGVICYACHPGIQAKCQRDIHSQKGMDCLDCHGPMQNVAYPARRPWVDEPKCGSCHSKSGFAFEQVNTLYRNSVGHGSVHCEACHGSPHAITPTTTIADNAEATLLQGHPGVIDVCAVCHKGTPDDRFFHRVSQ